MCGNLIRDIHSGIQLYEIFQYPQHKPLLPTRYEPMTLVNSIQKPMMTGQIVLRRASTFLQ
jgi:hypothetical protein